MQEARSLRFIGGYMVAEHLHNAIGHRFQESPMAFSVPFFLLIVALGVHKTALPASRGATTTSPQVGTSMRLMELVGSKYNGPGGTE